MWLILNLLLCEKCSTGVLCRSLVTSIQAFVCTKGLWIKTALEKHAITSNRDIITVLSHSCYSNQTIRSWLGTGFSKQIRLSDSTPSPTHFSNTKPSCAFGIDQGIQFFKKTMKISFFNASKTVALKCAAEHKAHSFRWNLLCHCIGKMNLRIVHALDKLTLSQA